MTERNDAFTLRIGISGLGLFTLEPLGDHQRMHVLLVEHATHPHKALLAYDAGYSNPDPNRALTGRLVCKSLKGRTLELGDVGTRIDPRYKLPRQIADLNEIAGANPLPRRHVLGAADPNTTGKVVNARFRTRSGTLSCKAGASWKVTKGPKPDWNEQLTTCATLVIDGLHGGSFNQWTLTDMRDETNVKTPDPLYPIDGKIEAFVYDVSLPHHGHSGPFEAGEPADHFEALYDLVEGQKDVVIPALAQRTTGTYFCVPQGVTSIDCTPAPEFGPQLFEFFTPLVVKCVGAQVKLAST